MKNKNDEKSLNIQLLGLPRCLSGKESACNVGDLGLIPGLERSTGEGNGYPLQYSGLENPHGEKSLEGYSPQGCKVLDRTEQVSTTQQAHNTSRIINRNGTSHHKRPSKLSQVR